MMTPGHYSLTTLDHVTDNDHTRSCLLIIIEPSPASFDLYLTSWSDPYCSTASNYVVEVGIDHIIITLFLQVPIAKLHYLHIVKHF